MSETGAENRILIGSAAAATVGFATIFIQPILLAEILQGMQLSESAAGFMLTVEMLAVGIASALCAKYCAGRTFRMIAIAGVAMALLGSILSWIAPTYETLLMARVITGLGEGVALMVSSAAPAYFADPDRAYAKINTVTIVIGSLLIYLAPTIATFSGGAMVFPTMILAFLVLLPAMFAFPRSRLYAPPEEQAPAASTTNARPLTVLWIAQLIVVIFGSSVFSFAAVIGPRTGMSGEDINNAIALGTLASLVGCALAGFISTRWGRAWPLTIVLVILGLELLIFCTVPHPLVFWIGLSVQMAGDYFLFPYTLGIAAEADPSGKAVAALNAAVPIAYAIGPLFGGAMLEFFDLALIGWFAVLMHLVVIGAMLFVIRNLRGAPAAAAPQQA